MVGRYGFSERLSIFVEFQTCVGTNATDAGVSNARRQARKLDGRHLTPEINEL
jgi:hypothetical protein